MRLIRLGAAGVVAGVVAVAAAPALAEWTERGTTVVTAQATGLREPLVEVQVTGTTALVRAEAAEDGARPAWLEVRRGDHVVCSSRRGTGPDTAALAEVCTDELPHGFAGEYTIEAGLGDWTSSVVRPVTTPLPSPTLTWAEGTDDGKPGDGVTSMRTPTVLLTAPPAAEGYRVTLAMNEEDLPLGPVDVPPGGLAAVKIAMAELGPGPHTLTAVSHRDGAPSAIAELALTVAEVPRVDTVTLADADRSEGRRGPIRGGDTVTIQFTESVDPASICHAWRSTASGPWTADATMTVERSVAGDQSVVTFGPRRESCGPSRPLVLGVLTLDATPLLRETPVAFDGSIAQLSDDKKTLTLTVGTGEGGRVWRLLREYDASFVPAIGVTSIHGHGVTNDLVVATGTF